MLTLIISLLQGGLKVALIGHSFVVGLEHYLVNKKMKATSFLHVDSIVSSISFYGIRGAKVQDLHTLLPLLRCESFDIVLLDIGSNDIANGARYEEVVLSLSFFLTALSALHSGIICVLSVVPRSAGLPAISPAQFMDTASRLEEHLKSWSKSSQNAIFHKHKGFYERQVDGKKVPLAPSEWSKDGIHPNNSTGRRKYANSLRLAIVKSAKQCKVSGLPVTLPL